MAHVQTPPSIQFATATCELGWVLVAHNSTGICAILLGDSLAAVQAELSRVFPGAVLSDISSTEPGAAATTGLHAVLELVRNPTAPFELPLDLGGTRFQQQVWQVLQTIPPGTTISYSDLAAQVGAPQAVRAVASACAANRLAIVVPCHRVLRKDAGLSGYRWQVARKQQLLAKEAALCSAA